MNQRIKMVGLDLDGTVFDDHKHIAKHTIDAIERAIGQGVIVLPATGRPLSGLPEELLAIPGIIYAVTANGAVVHNIRTREKLYEDCMDQDQALAILEALKPLEIMCDVFIDGMGYMEDEDLRDVLGHLSVSEMRKYFLKTRKVVENLPAFVQKKYKEHKGVEKMTINFKRKQGGLWHKEESLNILSPWNNIALVSGAPTNLEITRATATKGNGLLALAKLLGISRKEIMACGDSGNDREMLKAAGLGVAMANAAPEVKEAADVLTLSNNRAGVAAALEKYVLR